MITESQQLVKNYDMVAKLVILGEAKVGKSCLKQRYSEGKFSLENPATIGIDFSVKGIKVDDKHVKFEIWDTAGQEKFRSISWSVIPRAHAILVTYAVNDRESFNSTRLWLEQVKQRGAKDVVVILIGTKADVDSMYNSSNVHFPCRSVSFSEGKELADTYGIKFYETSARNGAGVSEIFETMTRDIMEGFKRRDARRRALQSTVKMDNDGPYSCLWNIFSYFRRSDKKPRTSSKSMKSMVDRSSSIYSSQRRGSSFVKEVGRN